MAHVGGERLSAQSTWRLQLLVVLLVAIRHAACRRPTLLAHLRARGWLTRDLTPPTLTRPNARELLVVTAGFAVLVGLVVA